MKFSKSIVASAFYLLGTPSTTTTTGGGGTTTSIGLVAAFGSPLLPLSSFIHIPAKKNRMMTITAITATTINRRMTIDDEHEQHPQRFRNRMDLTMSLKNDSNDNDNDNEVNNNADNNDDSSESNVHVATTTVTSPQEDTPTTKTTTTKSNTAISAAMAKAMALKERAGRERLEAERMSTLLILDKISKLEAKLEKLNSISSSSSKPGQGQGQGQGSNDDIIDGNNNNNGSSDTSIDDRNKAKNKKQSQIKQKDEIAEQIAMLQKQLRIDNGNSASKKNTSKDGNGTGTGNDINNVKKTIDASAAPLVAPKRILNADNDNNSTSISIINTEDIKMPTELLQKRVNAYKSFSPTVQTLFARAVNLHSDSSSSSSSSFPDAYSDEEAYATAIIIKVYQIEQTRMKEGTTNTAPMDLLDIANAQAGYETLPPPVQYMVKEMMDLKSCTNNTEIVEKLVVKNKVTRTNDGGVEFKMEDPGDENGDENKNGDMKKEKEARGENRDFTEKEVDSALKLYDNLPMAMKIMLAQSVNVKNESNSTAVVTRLIEEKKLLPSEDGVEFVVFGSGDEMNNLDLEFGNEQKENAGMEFVMGMLPEVTRKEGMGPTEEDAMDFFRLLGKKTFNPRNKPEKIPGGYVIRGENKKANGEELVQALDAMLKESGSTTGTGVGVGDKLYYYYMKDPTVVTQEQFDQGDFENPVIVLTGNNLAPTTNRFVKPIVTVFGGFSIASFAVAVCLSTDLKMDIEVMETMTSPLLFAVLGTQIAHEFMHQLVALKDKVRACTLFVCLFVKCVCLCICV